MERQGDVVHSTQEPGDHGGRCYCTLWRGLAEEENAPLTWFHCSRSLVAEPWERLVGRRVCVEPEGSCIAGDDVCRLAINLAEETA
jgi:hypothetical protein